MINIIKTKIIIFLKILTNYFLEFIFPEIPNLFQLFTITSILGFLISKPQNISFIIALFFFFGGVYILSKTNLYIKEKLKNISSNNEDKFFIEHYKFFTLSYIILNIIIISLLTLLLYKIVFNMFVNQKISDIQTSIILKNIDKDTAMKIINN